MDTFVDTIYLEYNIPRIGASSIITNMHNYMAVYIEVSACTNKNIFVTKKGSPIAIL